MSGKPLLRRARTDSAQLRREKRAKSCLTLPPFHVLERHDAPIFECDGLVRDWNARRDVSVIERIVEWAAEEHKRVPVMTCPGKSSTRAEAIAPPPRPIRSSIGVGSSFVIDVNPCLGWVPAHVAGDLAPRRAPSQPHGVLRHARANLASTYQCLIVGRKTLVDFRMLRNAVLGRLTTRNKQRADCHAKREPSGKN